MPLRSYRRLFFKFWTKNGHFAFLSPLEDLGATYTVHLTLIGKPVVDFLFVLIQPFSLGVTAEALQKNINWKSVFLKGMNLFLPNFHIERDVHQQLFLHGFFKAPPPLCGLGTTYTVHLRLIGKCIVNFLLVIIELSFH